MKNALSRPGLGRIALFVGLTYTFSWAVWAPAVPALNANTATSPAWATGLVLLGAASPSIMAIAMTVWISGWRGVARLMGKLARWRVGVHLYLAAILIPTLVYLAAAYIYGSTSSDLGALRSQNMIFIVFAFLSAAFSGPLLEELGWRGFLQPMMVTRFNLLITGFLIGLVWSLWHVPLFFAEGGSIVGGAQATPSAVLRFTALITGFTIIMTWLVASARGSVLIAYLFHLAINARASLWLFSDIQTETPEQLHQSIGRALDFQSKLLDFAIIPVWGVVLILLASGALFKSRAGLSSQE